MKNQINFDKSNYRLVYWIGAYNNNGVIIEDNFK